MDDCLILIQKLHGKEWGDVNGIHHTCGNNSIQHRPSIRADFGRAIIKYYITIPIEDIEPEYDTETQYVVKSYYVQDGKIYETYSVEEINDIPIDVLEE